jgi:hypothetical protein
MEQPRLSPLVQSLTIVVSSTSKSNFTATVDISGTTILVLLAAGKTIALSIVTTIIVASGTTILAALATGHTVVETTDQSFVTASVVSSGETPAVSVTSTLPYPPTVSTMYPLLYSSK